MLLSKNFVLSKPFFWSRLSGFTFFGWFNPTCMHLASLLSSCSVLPSLSSPFSACVLFYSSCFDPYLMSTPFLVSSCYPSLSPSLFIYSYGPQTSFFLFFKHIYSSYYDRTRVEWWFLEFSTHYNYFYTYPHTCC